MIRNVRRKVVRFEDRLLEPPFDKWGPIRHAILECGHALNVGRIGGTLPPYAPKRMACYECGVDRRPPA